MEDINESLDKLTDALEASEKTVVNPVLRVDDQAELAKKFLTPEGLTAITGKKSTALLGFDGSQCVAKCAFFGVTVATSNIALGVQKMADVANDLAYRGEIHSVLAGIGSLDLIMEFGKVPRSVVFFYPLVPLEKFDDIKKRYEFSLEEGSTGKSIGDVDVQLPPGEFIAEARISHYMTMNKVMAIEDNNSRIFKLASEYLKFLPEGTRLVGAKQLGISGLFIPYELRFFNPLLQRVKRVDLDYVREVARIDDKLEQFNLFTGIRYFGADGKRLYNSHYGEE